MRYSILSSLSVSLLCVGLAACSGTKASQSSQESEVQQSQWLLPSPQLATEMQMQAERMPWLKTAEERTHMIEWWAGLGEPGFAKLLEIVQDPRAKVADLGYAALASSRDGRLVPSLQEIPWDESAPMPLQYSRARCHLRLGDWSHVNILIKGLRDESRYNRAYCARILNSATNNDFGYHHDMPAAERDVAIARWEEWYAERAPEALQNIN